MTDNLPQVFLRAIEPEDLDILYGIENDMSLWNVSVTSVPYSRYTLYDYIANTKNDIYADRQVRMMIENANHDKGLAQSAINKIKEYSLDILHLHQLYAYINVDNKQSLNLFERCGFLPSNELKDWLFDGKNYHNALLMQLFL